MIFDTYGQGVENGAGDSSYTNDPLLGIKQPLTYKECLDIYRYFPLGKRIASALPNFALSAPREIVFKDLSPICAEEFKQLEEKLQILKLVKTLSVYIRVFGLSGLYIAIEGKEATDPLDFKELQKSNWAFTIQDSFTLQGVQISQDPLSIDYLKVINANIRGRPVHMSRLFVAFNDLPFYLQWVPSTYSFGSTSVYQNMIKLIKSWNRCVIALERMATKSSAIVFKNREGGIVSGLVAKAAKKSLELIRELQNDGAISIQREDSVEAFPLTGVDVVDRIISNMNQILLMALSDTPAAILLDKELAQGFGNGEEDMKAILMAVDNFRDTQLTPMYEFIDKALLYKMCSKDFLDRLRNDDLSANISSLSDQELTEKVINSFSYTWGNLYPETEATKIDNASKKLDNLLKLKELGANLEDIQTIINSDDALYKEEISLDSLPDDEFAEEDDEGSSFSETSESPDTREELNSDKK